MERVTESEKGPGRKISALMGICPQLKENRAQEVTESSWAEKDSHGRGGLRFILTVEQVFQEVELGVDGDGWGE